MKHTDYTLTIDLNDLDIQELDNIVRIRLLNAVEDLEFVEDDPEMVEALWKVIEYFSTPSQLDEYSKNKGSGNE